MKIAAIVGPTASGKTALAVALAVEHGLPIEVVSVDALQLYQRLDAGTAKPTVAERAAVPMHLIDLLPPTEAMHAARWAQAAEVVLGEIVQRGHWPVLVGGTGLYLRALLRGLAAIPEVPAAVREALADEWQERGSTAMWRELEERDPVYAAATPAQNRQRVLRALEVARHTGRAFSAWHAEHAALPDRHEALVIALDPPTTERSARIAQRARQMAPQLLAEVAQLHAEGLRPEAPGLQAIGYREAWARVQAAPADLAHGRPFADVLIAAHQAYAKKQATWFRSLNAQMRLERADAVAVADALATWFRPA